MSLQGPRYLAAVIAKKHPSMLKGVVALCGRCGEKRTIEAAVLRGGYWPRCECVGRKADAKERK